MTTRHPPLLIRASAGSGKTFQLANRFLAVLAAGAAPDDVLATTFTRKAAGEILERVLLRLATAIDNPAEFAQLRGFLNRAKLSRADAVGMLASLIRRLHRLRICTLDSFFGQIASSFALELGMPPGWRIIEETADSRLRALAIQSVLRGDPQEVMQLVHLLFKGEATQGISEQMQSLVTGLYAIYLETADNPTAWQRLVRRAELDAMQVAQAVDSLLHAPVSGVAITKARNADVDRAALGQWADFLKTGIAAKVAADETTYSRAAIPPDLIALYQPLVEHARAVLINQLSHQTEATRDLLEKFHHEYERLKQTGRVLRFEDVTRRLSALQSRGMGEVSFRIDARVDHLLLDEFQDTSLSQWGVIRPFGARIMETLGQGNSFFCVGDVKQAIYGWRGGIAEIFDALAAQWPELESQPLNQSFRSAPVVIETVNRIFENLPGNIVADRLGGDVRGFHQSFTAHSTSKADYPGYCRMVAAPAVDQGESQGDGTLHFAAAEIERLLAEAPGCDMGVLVRKNRTVARLIFELRSRGILASEEGGNPLTDSPAVTALLSALIMADHPGDTAARFHVAHSPLGAVLNFTDHTATPRALDLSHEIRARVMTNGYAATLQDWTAQLAASCDRRDLNRLNQLVELAYRHEASATVRAMDFVDYVSVTKVEDPTTARVRVMTVHQAKGLQFDIVVLPELDKRFNGMPPEVVAGRPSPTEPVDVVLRYANESLRQLLPEPLARVFQQHQNQQTREELCVLYVALTRAVYALHMIVNPSRPEEKTIPASYAGLLRGALTRGQFLNPEEVVFEHGDPQWFTRLSKAATVPAVEPDVEQRPVAARLTLAKAGTRRLRSLVRRRPSELEGNAQVDIRRLMRLESVALARGAIFHTWFSAIEWLDEQVPSDQQLLELAAAAGVPDVPPETIAEFREALAQPAIKNLLTRGDRMGPVRGSVQVWRERPFAVRDDNAILSGQFDRVVIERDPSGKPLAVEVLDYKTDDIAATNRAALQARCEHYRPQLAAYRRALGKLLNFPAGKITARLLFVRAGVEQLV